MGGGGGGRGAGKTVWNSKRLRGSGSALNFQRGTSLEITDRIAFPVKSSSMNRPVCPSRIKIDQAGVNNHTEK